MSASNERIDIRVNGEPRQVAAGTSLAALLEGFSLDPRRVAIEVNEQLVRRGDFGNTPLRPADRVEIVTLVGGG